MTNGNSLQLKNERYFGGRDYSFVQESKVAQQGCQINKALLEGMGWRTAGEKTGQMDEGEIRKD